MRHRLKIKHFNRDTKSRKALLRNSVRFLIERGEIKTSESRAKEVKRLADKLITKAQKGDLASRRQLHKFFGKRDVVNTLVDKVVPALGDRKTGFTSIKSIGKRRGDNTEIFKLSLLVEEKTWSSLNNDQDKAKKEEAKKAARAAKAKKAPAKKAAPKKAEKTEKKAPAKKATASKTKKEEKK
jgi:large subunit ribosomal protein L17